MDAISARNAEQVLREAVNINYAFSYDFDQVLSRFKKPQSAQRTQRNLKRSVHSVS
jgi:hypothetical protein